MGCCDTLRNIVFHYSQFFFLTLAITLGSGILGLPTKLADSGLLPFLISIVGSYLAQVLTLVFMTEVMQKAYYRDIAKLKVTDTANVPLHPDLNISPTYGSQDSPVMSPLDGSSDKPGEDGKPIKQCLPNLYSLGETYLPHILPYISIVLIFAMTTVVLISYILAGSQSYAVLIGASIYTIIPIFVWVLALVIILLDALIAPIVSVLTLFKGVFFFIAIILTFLAGLKHQVPIENNFSHTGDSFLMSIVALVGFVVALPMMFARAKQTRSGIIGFNVSIFLGVTTCLILNILWCWSISAVVPQHSVCLPKNDTAAIHIVLSLFNNTVGHCVKSPSLENAEANGEIATVPLSMILQSENSPFSHYLSILIVLFVTINVSVSFITVGSVLYHTLKGMVDSYWSTPSASILRYGGIFKCVSVQLIRQWFFALILFMLIFVIAFTNPKSFNALVQSVGSLLATFEIGVFFEIMIYKATYSKEFSSYVIPFPLPRWFLPVQLLIPVFYMCAFAYYVYTATIYFINS